MPVIENLYEINGDLVAQGDNGRLYFLKYGEWEAVPPLPDDDVTAEPTTPTE